jgi:hypothetical protein
MGRLVTYLVLALALILFGFAGLFSIGAPFLLTGMVMLVCFPWRHRRRILWPAVAGVWGFTLGYILLAPIGCTEYGTNEGLRLGFLSAAATTTCNGIFFDYAGGAPYNPPLLPAILIGVLVGLVSAIAVRTLLSRTDRGRAIARPVPPAG